jgi:hypothetical protein
MGLLPWTDRLVAGGLIQGARKSGFGTITDHAPFC